MHEHKKRIYHHPDVFEIVGRLIRTQNEEKATVFFDMYGHCQSLDVKVYAPVWESGADPSYNDEVYLDTLDDEIIADFKTRLFTYLNTL